MANEYRPHQALKVTAGELAGAVGTVLACTDDACTVQVQGILQGQQVDTVTEIGTGDLTPDMQWTPAPATVQEGEQA